MRRGVLIALAGTLVAVTACTSSATDGHPRSSIAAQSSAGPPTAAAEQRYGKAPHRAAGLTYQPDVVLVGGGASSVRSVSADSLTWTIDAQAPHADQLAVGKVMFLTSRGVGRVVQLVPAGDTLAVTIGPVQLGEIVRDGVLKADGPLDLNAASVQTFPGVGGLTTVPARTSASPSSSTTHNWAALRSEPELPPPTKGLGAELSVGGFSVELAGSQKATNAGSIDLKVGYNHGGVVLGLTFAIEYEDAHVSSEIHMAGGELAEGSRTEVTGITGAKVDVSGGSELGLKGNKKARIEVPAEQNFEIPSEPVPFVLSVRLKFIVETAFSARNATLTSTGRLAIDGPLGFVKTAGKLSLEQPSVSIKQNPVETIAGVSQGVNGLVFAAQMKIQMGVGIEVAEAGPFVAFTASVGLTNGSSIGIVQCKQATVDAILAGGIGLTIDPGESEWLKKSLGALTKLLPKLDVELGNVSVSVVHRSDYRPKVAVCHI
jgi:hypothetical protein